MNSLLTGLTISLSIQCSSSPCYRHYIDKIINDFPIHFLGFIFLLQLLYSVCGYIKNNIH